jgi:hypothetical protein
MVRATMIVEMAGRPPKHLTESLEKHIGILNQVTDITVNTIKVSEPRKIVIEEGKPSPAEDMFTAFAEADFECETLARLTQVMFDFMPSSVEVTEPSKVNLSAIEATDLMNNISGRLHRYDEFAKVAGAKMQQMNTQLQMAKKILDAKDAEIAKLKKGETGKSSVKKKVAKKAANKKKAPVKKKVASKKK